MYGDLVFFMDLPCLVRWMNAYICGYMYVTFFSLPSFPSHIFFFRVAFVEKLDSDDECGGF